MIKVLGSALLAILLLSGCQSSPNAKQTDKTSIQTYVSDLSCTASYQCKVIGIGERPACGGPSRYIVFSTKTVNESEVERLAEAETAREQILNENRVTEDSCKQVLPIQSLCIKNVCESFPINN
jgi:altronate dehydratase